MKKKAKNGSMLIEAIIAVTMLSIVATTLVSTLPQLLKQGSELRIYSKLIVLSDYVGNYIQRWLAIEPAFKDKQLDDYVDNELLNTQYQINQLQWDYALTNTINAVEDRYKTQITFHETVTRNNNALINVVIWYDTDNNDIAESTEPSINFSTVITEKISQ